MHPHADDVAASGIGALPAICILLSYKITESHGRMSSCIAPEKWSWRSVPAKLWKHLKLPGSGTHLTTVITTQLSRFCGIFQILPVSCWLTVMRVFPKKTKQGSANRYSVFLGVFTPACANVTRVTRCVNNAWTRRSFRIKSKVYIWVILKIKQLFSCLTFQYSCGYILLLLIKPQCCIMLWASQGIYTN